jgi:hypothetical protein
MLEFFVNDLASVLIEVGLKYWCFVKILFCVFRQKDPVKLVFLVLSFFLCHIVYCMLTSLGFSVSEDPRKGF